MCFRDFDFKQKNHHTTRVTPISATCSDHLSSSYELKTETIKTTMSDHYTMISQFPSVLDQGRFVNDEKIVVRNLQIIKAEKSLRFLFPLDQKLRM